MGKGAFGLVYECESKIKQDKNKYAIKFIKCQAGNMNFAEVQIGQ